MKFHYTYIIYCNEPTSKMYGCIYYGKHSTNNLLDGYITSGKKIKRYIKKYPNGYYKKILNLYNSINEVNQAEFNLIHNNLNKPYCLNLMEGGHGGAQGIEVSQKISNKLKGVKKTYKAGYNFYKNGRTNVGENNPFYNKTHTEEARKNISEKRIEYHKTHDAFQKNKKWINNGIKQTYVDISEVDNYISNGWSLGMIKRKIK